MKAKAAVFMGANVDFEVREFEVTKCPSGYGQMQLISSGVCGTDLHFHNGKLGINAPTIIGHEFVGKITDINGDEGEKYNLKIGDNVIADIAVPCGECILCKNGDDANCVNMKVTNGGSIEKAPYLYGGYAEVNYTPLANLVKIPDGVDPTIASVFACPGPTGIHACELAIKAGVDFSKINVAVVQGLGPVGMFAIAYLKSLGVKTVYAVVSRDNKKREELAIMLGAEKVFKLKVDGEEKVVNELKSQNGGLGVDLCFEASGVPSAVAQGFDILRNRGVYLIPGQYSFSGGVEIQPQVITFKALHVIGSSQYSMCDVKKYLEFMRNNKNLHPIIEKVATKYKIEDVNLAFSDAKAGKNIKTLLIK